MKKGGAEQELKALGQGQEVTVRIVTVNPQVSEVEVDVSQGTFNWDKEYARQILSKRQADGVTEPHAGNTSRRNDSLSPHVGPSLGGSSART